ncbi:hypothetical protein [Actinoplanes awajinensis]|uniref:hypothetical protein n=1 Tax=Actinoplanes awajinensis TaxID=135946 RepID=UPI000B22DF2E|nr:hypothetical protein [Actinoplanes awajinensis]
MREFCAYFAANTVSAIEAPGGTEVIYVTYRDVTVNDRLDTAHDRQRTRFGITPYRYRIPVNFAFSAPIYQLRITGPESHFVHNHYLSPMPDRLVAVRSGIGIRLDRNHGVSYTGLQTRGLNRLPEPLELECVAEFEEIPPGMLRRTLVVSAICALVTLAFAFVMPKCAAGQPGHRLRRVPTRSAGLRRYHGRDLRRAGAAIVTDHVRRAGRLRDDLLHEFGALRRPVADLAPHATSASLGSRPVPVAARRHDVASAGGGFDHGDVLPERGEHPPHAPLHVGPAPPSERHVDRWKDSS